MSLDETAIRLEGTLERGRFVYDFPDGSQAEMRFQEREPGAVVIYHTETPLQHRGKGVAARIVAHGVKALAAGGKRMIPTCPFVRAEFRAHAEWGSLLK